MSPTSYQTAPPRVKAGPELYGHPLARVNQTLQQQESPRTAGFLEYGTEEGTRTPTAYGHYHLKVACLPIPPPRQNGYCFGASGTSDASDAGAFCSSSTGTSSAAGFCWTSRTAGSGRPTCVSASAFSLAKNAKPKLVMKKAAASIPVNLLRKVEEPWLPNTVAEAPAPKEAPASAPLPCCNSTSATIPIAPIRCRTTTTVSSILQFPAARQIAPNSSAFREAPPTSPPSISCMPNNSAALAALTLPP